MKYKNVNQLFIDEFWMPEFSCFFFVYTHWFDLQAVEAFIWNQNFVKHSMTWKRAWLLVFVHPLTNSVNCECILFDPTAVKFLLQKVTTRWQVVVDLSWLEATSGYEVSDRLWMMRLPAWEYVPSFQIASSMPSFPALVHLFSSYNWFSFDNVSYHNSIVFFVASL